MDAGYGALEPCDHELARRIVAQPVPCAAANDRINRFGIKADGGITVGPERCEPEIVVHAAIGQGDALRAPRPIAFVEAI